MSLAAAIAIDRPRVNVVGSISIDLLVRLARLPAPGETAMGGQYEEIPEGEGANQPVAASRLHADVALIARIGDDEYGDEALRDLAESGIDTRHISISRGQRTGVAAILVDAQGENVIGVAPGGNARLTAGDVCRALAAVRDDYAVVVACLETPLSAVQAAATDEMPNAARIANVAAASSTEGHCGQERLAGRRSGAGLPRASDGTDGYAAWDVAPSLLSDQKAPPLSRGVPALNLRWKEPP